MTTDELMTEIERQKKYLARLPKDYQFPLFNSKQALESQRRSGYRNTAAAARELVDNAIEAGAKSIRIIFERRNREQKYERNDAIGAIAFIDNGSGMLPDMARYALTWGGGTHFDEPGMLGKFGFGLPNASINQARRVEVYTRTYAGDPWYMAYIDIDNFNEWGAQGITPAIPAELPPFVQRHIIENKLSLEHGTVVVWSRPDRLTYRTGASLKEHLVEDFGVVYRYLLQGGTDGSRVELVIDGMNVEPVDPLFLQHWTRYYLPPEQGGASEILSRAIPVRYYRDKKTGEPHMRKAERETDVQMDDPSLIAVGVIYVRIARLPVGFAVGTRKAQGDARRRFEIRKTRRGMSFVRGGREIETVDAFPRSARDEASGLGDWPLLQSYAYHWGIEVKFPPTLDEPFGITNDKQSVRPSLDFWRLLAEEGIDDLLSRENEWQREARERKPPTPATASPSQTPAEEAAAAADAALGTSPEVPPDSREEARAALEKAAQQKASLSGEDVKKVLGELRKQAQARRYRIDFSQMGENGPFYDHTWEGTQLVVWINRDHPFYKNFYAPLAALREGAKARAAVDLLLLSLAKPEATTKDAKLRIFYEAQRTRVWSTQLKLGLKVLRDTMRHEDSEESDI